MNLLRILFLSFLMISITACLPGDDDDDDQEEVVNEDANGGNDDGTDDGENQVVDITDKIFTDVSGDCMDYEGSFTADVTDIKENQDFEAETEVSATSGDCTIEGNGIPNHDFNDQSAAFATKVSEQNASYSFTTTPQMAANSTSLSLEVAEAVLLNGVVVDILPAACYGEGQGEPLGNEKIGCGGDKIDHPWRYDPMSSLNSFGTDEHNAHTQPSGKYHYHGNPKAMFEQDCSSATEVSGVIGFAADGFPLFGSCIQASNGTIREVQSSYRTKSGTRQAVSGYTTPAAGTGSIASNNYDGQFRGDYEYVDGLGDLDECNGMTVNGQYGYYVTNGFPWVLNCYKGTVDSSFSGQEARRSHSHSRIKH